MESRNNWVFASKGTYCEKLSNPAATNSLGLFEMYLYVIILRLSLKPTSILNDLLHAFPSKKKY
jgi:hypothetical protein